MNQTEEEWKKKLTSEEYQILRKKGTEAPFSGKYLHAKDSGIYHCRACGAELFSSDAKFDSGTGWPSFTEPSHTENIVLKEDLSQNMRRTEVVCKKCGSHLGHVFEDGPKTRPDGKPASGKRYCINSVCLDLNKK